MHLTHIFICRFKPRHVLLAVCGLLLILLQTDSLAGTKPPENMSQITQELHQESAKKPETTTRSDLYGTLQHERLDSNDSIYDIARQYDVGIVELVLANPGIRKSNFFNTIPVTLPTWHILPTPREEGIVVNLGELRLYVFDKNGQATHTFPVSVGKEATQTPKGKTEIIAKRKNPVWIPPQSVRDEQPDLPLSVPAGPGNPLGDYAMHLNLPNILIHGTNTPRSIGDPVSHGCIRMYPEDVKTLFQLSYVGMPVYVVDEPMKLGWHKDALYIEVHPTTNQVESLYQYARFNEEAIPDLENRITKEAGNQAARIDWDLVQKAVRERSGLPVKIMQD